MIECTFFLYWPFTNVTCNVTHDVNKILQCHTYLNILHILSLAAPTMPLFHGDTGTPQNIDHQTHQQACFNTAIISSLSSRSTLPSSHCVTNNAWRTHTSNGHNYVKLYSVALFYWTAMHSNDTFDVWILYTKSSTTVPDDSRTSGTKISKRPRSSGAEALGLQGFCVQFLKVYMENVQKNTYSKVFANVYLENENLFCKLYTKTSTTSTTFTDNRGTLCTKLYTKSSFSECFSARWPSDFRNKIFRNYHCHLAL